MKKILFIAYKFFDEDPRIVREAAACLRNGYSVDVICVARPRGDFAKLPDGISFFSTRSERKRASRLRYLFEYVYFFVYAFFVSALLQLRRKYQIVQVFVMPEFLVFSAVFSKLFGAKICMDWEDPSLEVYKTKYPGKTFISYVWAFKIIEKLAVRFADGVITPNIGFNKAFEKRGLNIKKFSTVMNAPDTIIFNGKEKLSPLIDSKHYSLIFNGTVFQRHGLHVAIQAIGMVKKKIPSVNLYIVGDGECEYMAVCKKMVEELEIKRHVTFIPRIPIENIPDVIYSASVGIVPNMSTPFTEINLPQRILEFGLMKKPMIIPRLSGILDYICEDEALFFEPGNAEQLAEGILNSKADPQAVSQMVERLYRKCQQYDWEKAYSNALFSICGETVAASA